MLCRALVLSLVISASAPASEPSENAPGWALQPISSPPVPKVPAANSAWARNEIDAFVLEKLLAKGLKPSPQANHRTLLRRLSLDLIGLPPTPLELAAFQQDWSPNAYENQVDRLLASPRYGERWARHWLDVAHYADSHGHDQDGPRNHAWPYRDYLIRSFNADKPYGRFVREQVAGDVLHPDDPAAIAATGFLAAGPWDESGLVAIQENSLDRLVAQYLDRDDIVTTTMSTFAGLTVGCARCHDHKFDPITAEDYYSLQAVFAGVDKGDRAYEADPALGKKRAALTAELAAARAATPAALLARQGEAAAFEAAWRTAESHWRAPEVLSLHSKHGAILKLLRDQSILSTGPRPDKDTYSIALGTELPRLTGLRLELFTDETLPQQGPGRADNGNLHLHEVRVFAKPRGQVGPGAPVPLKAGAADFNQEGYAVAATFDANAATSWGVHPHEGKPHRAVFEFAKPIGFEEGTELTVELDQHQGSGHLLGRFRLSLTAAAAPLNETMPLLPSSLRTALSTKPEWRTSAQKADLVRHGWQERVSRELAALPPPAKVYCASNRYEARGTFRPAATPRVVQVLKRGEVTKPVKVAKPGTVAAVPVKFALKSDDEGSRRAALAAWLTDPANPPTWRVIVNRVWHYHFGKGLVDTPNDFGKMGGAPSHPELLDWLALEFQRGGGSLKSLHRLIVCSASYRQAGRSDPAALAIDADNRLLWRAHRQRLDAEQVRDSILLASGRLDDTMYGPPVMHFAMKPGPTDFPVAHYDLFDLDAPGSRRRSVYRFIFRTQPDPLLAALDCPEASLSAPVRGVSVGALQALALWNDKFTLRHAEHLAALAVKASPDAAEQVRFLARQLFGRAATADEVRDWGAYAQTHGLANLGRVLFNSSEFLFIE